MLDVEMPLADAQLSASAVIHTSAKKGRSALSIHVCFGFPVLLASLLLAMISLFLPANTADPDIGWHLRNAQVQMAAHSWIRQDMYSYTVHGTAWIDHEWLAEIPYYLGWKLAGQSGLQAVTFLALAGVFIGVFFLSFRNARNIYSAFLCTAISVFLGTVSFGPRTLLFGWIFFVIELILLDLFAAGTILPRRLPWILFPLFLVWINTHGSWVIGLVVLIAFAAGGIRRCETCALQNQPWTHEQRIGLLIGIAASAGALFVNPYGWRLVFYPIDLAFRQKLNITSIEEWRTLDFHSPRGRCFLLVLFLLFISQIIRQRKWAFYELAFVAIGVYSALTYSRFLFLAGILVLPLAAKDLALWLPRRPNPDRPLLNAGIMAALLIALLPWHRRLPAAEADGTYPQQALPFLKTFNPQNRVFNDYLWGGYLIWNTPNIPVFIDSRVDIFERAGIFKDYLDASRIQNSREILDKYKICYVLFRRDAPLVYLLKSTHDWKIDYEDPVTVLLERMQPITP